MDSVQRGWHAGCGAMGGAGAFCSTPAGRRWVCAVTASPCLLLPSPGSFSQPLLEEEGLWERRSLELEETVQSGIRLNKFSSEISSCVQGEMRKGAG